MLRCFSDERTKSCVRKIVRGISKRASTRRELPDNGPHLLQIRSSGCQR